MGRFNWFATESFLGSLSLRLQSLQRSLLAQRPALRWALAGAVLAATTFVGYIAFAIQGTTQSVYLNSGRRFAPDDVSKIARAFDHQRITYHLDDERRVLVPSAKREQAEEVVAKLDLGPRMPGELRDQAISSSPWESPGDRAAREHLDRAKIVETMINDLPGIVRSFVGVNRPKARLTLQPTGKPSALVWLETDGDRQLPFRTVQSITTILTGYEEGLSADAITVVDRRGHKYLVAGNPELSALSSNRAREEELSQEILEEFHWIKGMRVSVQLPGGEVPNSRPSGGPVGATVTASPPTRPSHPASGPSRDVPAPALSLNRTMSLDTEPAAANSTSPSRSSSPEPAGGDSSSESTSASSSSRAPSQPGRVWIRVPRSYYYQVSLVPGHKEPSREDLMKLAARTEEQIRTGVGLIVPLSGPAGWKITVDIIQDELPTSDSSVASASDRRVPALDWGIAGAMGAMAATLVALGSWALYARRPISRGESTPRRLRYDAGTANSPGPSEKVREFVRRNPEAAVSVLERWTSQRGTLS
jgi:hypothetical protein